MAPKGESSNLYKFHRPHALPLHSAPVPLPRLTRSSKQCLRNLAAYRTPHIPFRVPRARCAAVLVALFVGRDGALYVLLSRRASTLRTYAGDTALPGGKVDPDDRTIEDTARREAFEEIGLPADPLKAPLLCVLPPFLARNALLVTPVVVLILDTTLKPILNAAEVHSLFSHPLLAFLAEDAPFADQATVEFDYHTHEDIPYPPDPEPKRRVRMHRFLTGREAGGTKPVFGLTAAIMIRVATIGYAQEPLFDVYAPDQPSMNERISYALRNDEVFRKAFHEEGLDPDNVPVIETKRGKGGKEGERERETARRRRRADVRARSKL